jgi:ATP-dependent Clp endopeptidase proteolytic subunit ClpP
MRGARPLRSVKRLQNLTSAPTRWWSITNRADEPTLVSIFDEIGFYGVSAGDFLAELSGVKGDIDMHINSPGGDVFDAIAIYNTLKQRKGIVAITIDGLAASAASFIAQAATKGHLTMAPHSRMMIHDGFAAGIGNAADMRELADQLDDASDNIASIYAERSGKAASYWRAKMQATTWYTDAEAVKDGLADQVGGGGNTTNSWDLTVFNAEVATEPEADKAAEPAPVVESVKDTPDNHIDPVLLSAVLGKALEGGNS